MEKQRCKLCGEEKKLQYSHIIPKFVFNYLKDTSATGYLRDIENINKRELDGFKIHLLCRDCEQLISNFETSNFETKFSTNIFIPCQHKEGIYIEYSQYLLKFAVSVSWRVLVYLLKDDDMAEYNFNIKENIKMCLVAWEKFLLDETPHPSVFEQHLIVFDTVESYSYRSDAVYLNTYLSRSVDINFLFSENEAVVYTKMCNYLLIGFIQVSERKLWRGTKIHVKRGTISGRDITVPEWLFHYIFDRSQHIKEKYDILLSEKQYVNINDTIKQNKERVFKSETLKMRYADMLLK